MNARTELAATLLLLGGLGLVLALAAAPVEMARDQPGPHQPEPNQPRPPAPDRDGEILAACMNGGRIYLGDRKTLTCRISEMGMGEMGEMGI